MNYVSEATLYTTIWMYPICLSVIFFPVIFMIPEVGVLVLTIALKKPVYKLAEFFNLSSYINCCRNVLNIVCSNMKLLIKNMVSLRCKMIVKSELEKFSLHYTIVELGEVEIREELTEQKRQKFKNALLKFGLEVMDDQKTMLIEKVKNIIVEMIHYNEELPKINFSDYLSEKLHYDYTYLSNLFSEVKGITIEHYIISHKIERAKEMLIYNELTLTEIAYQLNYSSLSHLSNQFKKVTGLTPSFFKNMKHKRLIGREDL